MKTYKIASIPGDGLGIEVLDAGLRVLNALAERDGGFALDVTSFDWGSDRYKREGALMPADGAQDLKIMTLFSLVLSARLICPTI